MAGPVATFLTSTFGSTAAKAALASAAKTIPLWASVTAHVIVAGATMVGSALLAPKNRFGQGNDRNSLTVRGANSLGSTTNRQYIYGEIKVGGTIVYMGTSDFDSGVTGNDNRYLHMALVHCDHETEELGDLYVNGEIVSFSAYSSDGALRSATGTRYSGSLWIADHHGGPSQTVNSTLDAAMGNWGSSDKLSGMSYTYIRLLLRDGDENAFPTGIPEFQRVVKGRKVYDPREASHDPDDSTTWEYSSNWALCVADYLQSEFGYGRIGLGHSKINETELIASANNSDETVNSKWDNWSASEDVALHTQRLITEGAILVCTTAGTTGTSEPAGPYSGGETNISDGTAIWRVLYANATGTESRYELNGIVNSDEDPMEVVRSMRTAADGLVEYIGGEWFVRSGRYITPTITLDESDFAGPISGTTKDDRTVSVNTIKGVIVNKDDAYNVIDVPSFTNSTFVAEDNGVVSTRELELLFTNSPASAQRLFKIALAKARQQISHKATFTAKAMQLQVGDNFKLDFARYNYSSTASTPTTFQVWSHQLKIGGNGELLVDMEFREIASNTYDFDATTDQTTVDPAPTSFLPDPFTVSAPTAMSASSGTDQLIDSSDGTILPTVLVTWTGASDVNVIGYQLRWKYVNVSTDTQYRYFTVNGRNNTSLVITGVRESRSDANRYIDIDIRSLTPVKEGEWTVVEHDHDVIGKSAAPSTPTGPGTGSKPEVTPIVEGLKIEMDEGKLSDLDFFNYHIWVKTTNSPPTYNSTTKLYSEVATTSTSGTTKTITDLTAGQNYYVWVAAMDGGRRFSSLTEATPFPAVPATNFLDVSTQTLSAQIEVGQSGVPTDWSDYDMSVGLYVEGATATYVSSTPTSSGEFTITAESATPSGWTMVSSVSSGQYMVGIRGRPNSYGDFQLTKTYTIDYMDARGVIHELQVVRQWHILQRYVLGPPRFNPITLPAKGGSGLGFKINYLNASTANDGEVFVAGTTFTKPNGTTTTGITENYVGTPYEGTASPSLSGTVGDVFLMWTDTAANTRFSPLTFTHQNVVPIRESSSGGYEVFNNSGTGQSITFASTDVLLATVWRDENSTGLTGIEEYIDKNLGQSKNFVTGVSGYKIDAETGDAEFNDVTVRGDLVAGTVDIGTGFSRTQIDSNGVSSWAGGRIQINASDSAFGDVGQKWTGSPIESIWIDCNTTTLPANLYFGNVSSGAANAFITGQGNAEFKTLDVTTSLDLNNSTLDASNGVGTSGQVLSSTGTGTQWIDSVAGLWTQTGSDIYYNSGRVGIGTSTPSDKLHVVGVGKITTAVLTPLVKSGNASGNVVLQGGNSGGANIELYGESHASLANDAYYDADVHNFRSASAATAYATFAAAEIDFTRSLNMNNNNITGVNSFTFNDAGPNEGITWGGGSGWSIYESPDDLTTNSAGNLQFVDSGSRIFTLNTSGNAEFTGSVNVAETLVVDRPSDAWTTNTTWLTLGQGGSNDIYGVINTGGSYAITYNGNGYRKGSSQWQSLGVNSTTGATQIWQYPTGQITFNTNSNWASGSSSVVTERVRIDSGGNVGIGTTLGGYKLRVNGTARIEDTLVLGDVGSEGGEINILDQNNGNTNRLVIDVDAAGNGRMFNAGNGNLHLGNLTGGTGETRLYCNADAKVKVKSTQTEITDQLYVSGYAGSDSIVTINGIDCGGGMLVQGSLDVDNNLDVSGSKNFRIAHPVRDGHDLRHTCIESPQADLTYRGKATLVDGTVQVDLDSEFGMTAGTFAALNDDVQVFVQNETGWDAVRGSVSDGVLTINCYNLDSDDSVGWLVIGRRTGIELEIEPETKIK